LVKKLLQFVVHGGLRKIRREFQKSIFIRTPKIVEVGALATPGWTICRSAATFIHPVNAP
jgi:hypothetical protein